MSLKSLVNKSVIKSDLRRYWYLGAMFTVLLLLTAVMPAYDAVHSFSYEMSTDSFAGIFAGSTQISALAVIACGIITPAMIFSYLHHRSAVHTLHSLPLRRETLYFSHLVSTGILMTAPVIINMLIMLTIKGIHPADAFLWTALTLVYVFVITGFGAAAAMLTANVFASIVLPYMVMLLPLFIEAITDLLCSRYLYGYVNNSSMSVSSHIYADFNQLLDGMLLVYIALGILFFFLGLAAYRKRALENNGQLTAFSFLEPVFLYGVAVCAGFLGYVYISSFLENDGSFWLAVPFGIAGIIAARMIIERTFKPGKIIKPSVIYLAVMCIIYAFIGLDITGYEKRVPDAADVASASIINYDGSESYYPTMGDPNYSSVRLAPEAVHDPSLYNDEDIKKVIALHRGIIAEMDDKQENRFLRFIPVRYTLKNGSTLERHYYIYHMSDELDALYGEVMDTVPVKADRFPILSDSAKEYTSVQVSTCGTNSSNLTNEQMNELIAVLKEDITSASYGEYDNDTLTSINFNLIMPSTDEAGSPITDKNNWASTSVTYAVHPAYKKTISLLEAWGMYDVMPEADDIQSAEYRDYDENTGDDIRHITDKAEIQRILDYLRDNRDYPDRSYKGISLFYTNGTSWTINVQDFPS
ncbi:MAG: DUF6449 domain-containing protein [Clostridiales bacterium]|nr:DUF6449 domain-containing protein [Clostridiales bacterium]